jgi:hypothetical protein
MSQSSDSPLDELYLLWRNRHEQGDPISASQLCSEQGCPELAAALIDQIVAIAKFEERFVEPDTVSPQATQPSAAPPAKEFAPATEQIPGFVLLEELGRGGMGVVYKARQANLDRIVALKLIRSGGRADPAEKARLQAEARAIANLRHENIVQLYDAGEHAGQLYYFMELMEGGSLAAQLNGTPCGLPRKLPA